MVLASWNDSHQDIIDKARENGLPIITIKQEHQFGKLRANVIYVVELGFKTDTFYEAFIDFICRLYETQEAYLHVKSPNVTYATFLASCEIRNSQTFLQVKRRINELFGIDKPLKNHYLEEVLQIRNKMVFRVSRDIDSFDQEIKKEMVFKEGCPNFLFASEDQKIEMQTLYERSVVNFSPSFKRSLKEYYPKIIESSASINLSGAEVACLIALKKDILFYNAIGRFVVVENPCAQWETFIIQNDKQAQWHEEIKTFLSTIKTPLNPPRPQGLLLSSLESGLGKTHLLLAVAKESFLYGLHVIFFNTTFFNSVTSDEDFLPAVWINNQIASAGDRRILWIFDDWNLSSESQEASFLADLIPLLTVRTDAVLLTSLFDYPQFSKLLLEGAADNTARLHRRMNELFGFELPKEYEYLQRAQELRGAGGAMLANSLTQQRIMELLVSSNLSHDFIEGLRPYYPLLMLNLDQLDISLLTEDNLIALEKDILFYNACCTEGVIPKEDLYAQWDIFHCDTPLQTLWYSRANQLLEEVNSGSRRGMGMFLAGAAGLGKTHLAIAVAKECLKEGYYPIYIRPETNQDGDSIQDSIDNLLSGNFGKGSPIVWILDDCNSSFGVVKDFFLKLVIRARELGDLLLVTSNMEYESFNAGLFTSYDLHSQRLSRRIKELLGVEPSTESLHLARAIKIRSQLISPATSETKGELEKLCKKFSKQFSSPFIQALCRYYPALTIGPNNTIDLSELSEGQLIALKKDIMLYRVLGNAIPAENFCVQMDIYTVDEFDDDAVSDDESDDDAIYEQRLQWYQEINQLLARIQSQDRDSLGAYGMFLSGEAGIGKTHLALAFAKECLFLGYQVIYYKPESPFQYKTFNQRPTIWILDDWNDPYGLGADYLGDLIQQIMRSKQGDILLVTSNTPYSQYIQTASSNVIVKFPILLANTLFTMQSLSEVSGQNVRQIGLFSSAESQASNERSTKDKDASLVATTTTTTSLYKSGG